MIIDDDGTAIPLCLAGPVLWALTTLMSKSSCNSNVDHKKSMTKAGILFSLIESLIPYVLILFLRWEFSK